MTYPIRVVVFDHGGVLTPGGRAKTNETAAAREMGLTDPLDIPDLNHDLKIGAISGDIYIREINKRYPDAPRPLTEHLWDTIYTQLAPDREAYAFAARLRLDGLVDHIAILSSVNVPIAKRIGADGGYDGFDAVQLSCYTGYAKPYPQAYMGVELEFPASLHAAQFLFLDDQDRCVDGARARGWQALRVDSTAQMIRDVTALLRAGESR